MEKSNRLDSFCNKCQSSAVTNEKIKNSFDYICYLENLVKNGDSGGFIEGTYEEIEEIKNNNELDPNKRYVIIDYKTEYYIEGSMSGDIVEEAEVTGIVSGFGAFLPDGVSSAANGLQAKVKFLPEGYTGSIEVGDTTTITSYFSEFYFKFANGAHTIIGAILEIQTPRFKRLTQFNNATVTDSNGLPIITPSGVINTDVHNGSPYMSMTSEENKAVPTEKIILTPLDGSTFSIDAESRTYLGDVLEYDFDDNEIKNENNEVIGKRSGLVKRRINREQKLIDLRDDWRAKRYRRYSPESFEEYSLISDNDSLYRVNGAHACTVSNLNITEDHKLILPFIENDNFYNDFTVRSDGNPFLNGDTAPIILYGRRFETEGQNQYSKNLDSKVDLSTAKDIFILPLDNEFEPIEEVKKCVVRDVIKNTVFQNLPYQFGETANMVVESNEIQYSTFKSMPEILNTNSIKELTCIDIPYLTSCNFIEKSHILTTAEIDGTGNFIKSTIGGYPSNIRPYGVTFVGIETTGGTQIKNSIFGGKRVDNFLISNTVFNKSLFIGDRTQYSALRDSTLFLTAIILGGTNSVIDIELNTGLNNNPRKSPPALGYYLVSGSGLNQKKLIGNTAGDLVYEDIDFNDNSKTITTYITSQ